MVDDVHAATARGRHERPQPLACEGRVRRAVLRVEPVAGHKQRPAHQGKPGDHGRPQLGVARPDGPGLPEPRRDAAAADALDAECVRDDGQAARDLGVLIVGAAGALAAPLACFVERCRAAPPPVVGRLLPLPLMLSEVLTPQRPPRDPVAICTMVRRQALDQQEEPLVQVAREAVAREDNVVIPLQHRAGARRGDVDALLPATRAAIPRARRRDGGHEGQRASHQRGAAQVHASADRTMGCSTRNKQSSRAHPQCAQ